MEIKLASKKPSTLARMIPVILAAGGLVLVGNSSASAAQGDCKNNFPVHGDNNFCAWENADYDGRIYPLFVAEQVGQPCVNTTEVFNDSFSSIYNGSNRRVLAYRDANCGGQFFIVHSGEAISNLASFNDILGQGPWNDQISSLRVLGG
jgi:hypothetical protein